MNLKPEVQRNAAEITDKFDKLGVAVEPTEVYDELFKHYKHHSLSVEAASKHVSDLLRRRHSISESQYDNAGTQADYAAVDDVNSADEWVTLQVTIQQTWEPTSPKIKQVGLLGDESGKKKWTCFDASIPTLEEGESYIIRNAVTSKFNDNIEIILNKATSVIQLSDRNKEPVKFGLGHDEDNNQNGRTTDLPTGESVSVSGDVVGETTTIEGNVVSVSDESGFVEECPALGCGSLDDGVCDIHGFVDEDKRVNTLEAEITVETKDEAYTVVIPDELVEQITGLSHAEATQLTDASPADNPVRDKIIIEMLCKWVRLEVEDATATAQKITINPQLEQATVEVVASNYSR